MNDPLWTVYAHRGSVGARVRLTLDDIGMLARSSDWAIWLELDNVAVRVAAEGAR